MTSPISSTPTSSTPQAAGAHAATAYDRAARGLHAAGRDWTDVRAVTEYVAGTAHHDEVADARRAVLPAGTAVVTVITEPLPGEPLVHVEPDVGLGDGVVHLPAVLPVDRAGELVAPGDFRGQYTWCLERAGELLADLGLDLGHLVQTVDFSTPATRDEYRRTHRPRTALLGPVFPGAAGILVSALPHPGALVGFELVASRHRPVAVNPGWARYETLTYNPAVRAGDVLFGSGFAALDMDTQEALHAGDVEAQTRATYEAVDAVLRAAGIGPERVVRSVEYLCPGADPAAVAAARPGLPATTIGCAALLRPEFLLEVIPTAVLP